MYILKIILTVYKPASQKSFQEGIKNLGLTAQPWGGTFFRFFPWHSGLEMYHCKSFRCKKSYILLTQFKSFHWSTFQKPLNSFNTNLMFDRHDDKYIDLLIFEGLWVTTYSRDMPCLLSVKCLHAFNFSHRRQL